MKEFQVNNYITLKLEDGKTNIYVGGELFEQCRFLLLNIPINEISSFDEINSVDEAAANLSKKGEKRYFPWGENKISEIISPEIEFWAHSSNLQVWSEYDYDTRLIHSNLAFPLLKKLTEVGDLSAKKVFKEEIAKRLESGYWPVTEYLMRGDYTGYLSREEFLSCILEDENEIHFLLEIEKLNDIRFYLEKELSGEYNNFTVENRNIVGLCIDSLKIEGILPFIVNLKSLEILFLIHCTIQNVPESICYLQFLKKLHFFENGLEILPDCLGNLQNLEELELIGNHLSKLPKNIENLKALIKLDLGGNKFKEVPKELESLDNLRKLRIKNNPINKNSNVLEELKKKGIEIII